MCRATRDCLFFPAQENMRKCRNWQTSKTKDLVIAISCGFKSHLPQEKEALVLCTRFSFSCGRELAPRGFPYRTRNTLRVFRRKSHLPRCIEWGKFPRCHRHAAPHLPQRCISRTPSSAAVFSSSPIFLRNNVSACHGWEGVVK